MRLADRSIWRHVAQNSQFELGFLPILLEDHARKPGIDRRRMPVDGVRRTVIHVRSDQGTLPARTYRARNGIFCCPAG